MLTHYQKIVVECDVCRRKETLVEGLVEPGRIPSIARTPQDWLSIGHLIVCPAHQHVEITFHIRTAVIEKTQIILKKPKVRKKNGLRKDTR